MSKLTLTFNICDVSDGEVVVGMPSPLLLYPENV